ncbi:hypothetical protein HOH45_00740 [bacterium]|jgi:hypothetical protein|nr:hypothetical protein [bacterium]
MTTFDHDNLKQSLDNLSDKRDVLSESAIRAKKDFDLYKEIESKKQIQTVGYRDDFTDSVRILSSIFEQSKFDEMAIFISNPSRVLGLNLFIGIIRGIGFALGILMISLLLLYLYKSAYPDHTFFHFIEKLTQFMQA